MKLVVKKENGSIKERDDSDGRQFLRKAVCRGRGEYKYSTEYQVVLSKKECKEQRPGVSTEIAANFRA